MTATPIFDELRGRAARASTSATAVTGTTATATATATAEPQGSHARGDRTVLDLLRAGRAAPADGTARREEPERRPSGHREPAPGAPLRVLSFARPAG